MHPQSDGYPDYPDWQSGVHDNKYLNIDIMLLSKIKMIIRERKIPPCEPYSVASAV